MTHEKFDPSKLDKLNDPVRMARMEPLRIWTAAGIANPAVVVEIGAGTGIFAEAFANFAPSVKVYAVDTEARMIQWMERHRAPKLHGRLVPVLATDTMVPLPDGTADAAFMIDLHHELSSPDATYAEVYRLLAPGRKVVVVDWRKDNEPGGPPQEIRVSEAEIAATLERTGFRQVTTHEGPVRHSMITAVKQWPGNAGAEERAR
jgi:SAM-dependent methyltransferase